MSEIGAQMDLAVKTLVESLYKFNGQGFYMAVFFAALIYLCVKYDKNDRKLFFYPIIAIFVLVLNPITMTVLLNTMLQHYIFWRMFWIFPIVILPAYVGTKILFNQKKRIKKVTVSILLVALIMLSGKFIFTSANYSKADNLYKVPVDAVNVVNVLKSVDENPHAILPPELVCYARQYDEDVISTYGRTVIMFGVDNASEDIVKAEVLLYNSLYMPDSDDLSIEDYRRLLKSTNTEYIVVALDSENMSVVEAIGCEHIGDTDRYRVYRLLI